MTQYNLTPTVDETQEFIEIANDFSNPLEVVREAISNAWDAGATRIDILFGMSPSAGEDVLRITLRDNGHGMDRKGLQSFFDLGNSLRRDDPNAIGEKGHGTKVYFNSSSIEIRTVREGMKRTAILDHPFKKLHMRQIPIALVEEAPAEPSDDTGTEIIIIGYNNNRRDRFTHERLKDYVRWFTKFGSIESQLGSAMTVTVPVLYLQGLDADKPEKIEFGHPFPPESQDLNKLFEQHEVRAPHFYCRRIIRQGALPNHPEIKYQLIISLEGSNVKYSYNGMLRRSGYSAPQGSYTIQDRYGIWLCKDCIPVQRKNEWITSKGSEYTRFHAFLNCQKFRLTANRGSVDNTPSEVMQDIETVVKSIYAEVLEGSDWREWSWLESEVSAYRTVEKEKRDFQWRVTKANRSNICSVDGHILVEPQRESGVFSLFIQLAILKPALFPFEVLDYDTHEGIDIVVKGDKTTPLTQSRLFYVEFKYYLSGDFNHSFENLNSIVCWDTQLKHNDEVKDISGQCRKLVICPKDKECGYTRYFLDHPGKPIKIEVYVLKDHLREKLGLEFRPRTEATTIK